MTNYKQPAAQADHTENHLEMAGRWYMVNKMGMATLCTDKDGAEKEAADAQRFWPHMGPHRAVQLVEAADVEALRSGYAAARLEIESLQARIKTMAEEHADELTVAHLDGRMRSAQIMPESIRSILVRCRNFIDTTKVPAYPAGADLADEIDNVLLAAQPAGAQQPGAAYAALPAHSHAGQVYEEGFLIGTCPLYTADKMRAFADATHALRASHGQAPAQAAHQQEAPAMHSGWVSCTIAFDGSGPEEVAYGPKIMMDRLAKWLGKHFERTIAEKAAPQPLPASQGDALDAARLDWLLLHISGAEFRRIGVHYSGNARRADVDAARAAQEGKNHD